MEEVSYYPFGAAAPNTAEAFPKVGVKVQSHSVTLGNVAVGTVQVVQPVVEHEEQGDII